MERLSLEGPKLVNNTRKPHKHLHEQQQQQSIAEHQYEAYTKSGTVRDIVDALLGHFSVILPLKLPGHFLELSWNLGSSKRQVEEDEFPSHANGLTVVARQYQIALPLPTKLWECDTSYSTHWQGCNKTCKVQPK